MLPVARKKQIRAIKGIQLSKTLFPAAKQYGDGFLYPLAT